MRTAIQVQLQGEKENTCVSCATVNALRCWGREADIVAVVESLTVKRFGENGGSLVHKAAKYLRQVHGMQVVISRPKHLVRDPGEAAYETAIRFEAMLKLGYVGLLHRRETKAVGHAVVLYQIVWREGEPYFVCYDSNKRNARGKWMYRVVDYVTWNPNDPRAPVTIEDDPDDLQPTGRVGYFVKPQIEQLNSSRWPSDRSPFRARNRRPRSTGATGPPEG